MFDANLRGHLGLEPLLVRAITVNKNSKLYKEGVRSGDYVVGTKTPAPKCGFLVHINGEIIYIDPDVGDALSFPEWLVFERVSNLADQKYLRVDKK